MITSKNIIDKNLIRALNDAAPRGYFFDKVYFKNEKYFSYYTGEQPGAGDYDDGGKLVALVVEYPADYYAENLYITNDEIIKLYKETENGVFDEMIQKIIDYAEI